MILRFAGSNTTLLFMAICILIGAVGIVTEQVEFLIKNYQLDFIVSEITLEESVVILVAAFGAFLEHRRWLLNKVFVDNIPPSVNEFDRYSHDTGIVLILIAIFMESIDLFFLALNNWGIEFSMLKYIEVCILFILNAIAISVVSYFGFNVIKQVD